MNLDNILTLKDAEETARSVLPGNIFNMIQGGAMYEHTVMENELAMKKYKLRPRVLRDVSNRDVSTQILGNRIDFPVGVSPSALHKVTNVEGEISMARACLAANIPLTIGMVSSVSARDVLKACPSLICLQQLLITKPKSLTERFVKESEECGVKGLVVTVDYPVYTIKLREIRYKSDLQSRLDHYSKPSDAELNKLLSSSYDDMMQVLFHGTSTWEDITWLKSITYLPVIIKGILTPEDAMEAVNRGVDAVWVSNHGGRTLDSTPATIDVLSEVVRVIGGKCEVYVDGGFRTGPDVFKAIALGADVVFVGRPARYGHAISGEHGVTKVLDILKKEFDNTVALSGCRCLKDITKEHVYLPAGPCGKCKL